MGVRFDKQLWFNLKESKRDYLSIYFRLVIELLNSVPSGPSMTLLQLSMGIWASWDMKFKGSPHGPPISPPISALGGVSALCSGGWYAGQITVPSIPSPAPWVPPAPCCSIGRLQAQPLVLQPSQPSPAQASPTSPGQHRLLLFTQWSSATAQPRPTTAQPPPISWSRAARTVTPSRDQWHVSRVTTPATCTSITSSSSSREQSAE